ncbi:MAG: acetyl esterase/lipase [Flavobacteriaceae bacterium]|jgi:acetyl esterase/lipase
MRITFYGMIIGLVILSAGHSYAQGYSKEVIELWEEGKVPFNKKNIELEEKIDSENKRFTQISNPVIYLYRKKGVKNIGPALLYCPGGGYATVSIGVDRGESYARLFFEMGFNVVAVLKYRLPDSRIVNEQEKVPLCDAQKALSMLHTNAKKWKIDKSKIGVKGASSGGHLAASLNNLKKDIVAPGVKSEELTQAFSILRAPVISFNPPFRHKGSYKRLLIDKASDPVLLDYYSMENQVSSSTPPTFIIHATDDLSVNYQNSVIYTEQLKKYKIPYRYVQLNKGGHGFGLNRSKVDRDWIPDLKEWLNKVLME